MATGSLVEVFRVGVMDSNGDPVAGGLVETYAAGTSTPLATYADSALTILNANPVVLDAAGRAVIYLQAKNYKIVLKDSTGTTLWTQDCWQDLGQIVAASNVARTARTIEFDLDDDASGLDTVLMALSQAVTISAARVIYTAVTSGTVAAGSVKIGTTLGGGEIVAETNYQNGVAVGTRQALTLVDGAVPAEQSIFVRHTGVAPTQAGRAHVEIEFT